MSSKILIGDVSMPSDSLVRNQKIFEALRKRGCRQEELDYIDSLIQGREAYDFSGYSGITTIVIPKTKPEEIGYCIKLSDNPSELYESSIICNLMSKYNLSSKVVKYISTNKDYLITEQIEAPMAVNVFGDFRTLAKFMGETLRNFHNISWKIDQMTEEELRILNSRTNTMFEKALSHEKGLEFLAQYQKNLDYESMKEYLKQHQYEYVSDDVMIHGDYNPRNVFAKGNNFAGTVDFADTCFGDRHYDIYFSMWTVALYSGIIGQEDLVSECENIFLDAYGREKIDISRMELCKKLTCMFWQEHNDIKALI